MRRGLARSLPVLVLLAGCGREEAPLLTPTAELAATAPSVGASPSPEAPAEAAHLAARHVLVTWQGAAGARPGVSRTREEARRRAEEVRTRLLAGEDMATLARHLSDCASAERGGFLGGFEAHEMDPAFVAAVAALEVGAVSPIVETPFGYHVIRREPFEEVHLAQVLVRWKGLEGNPPDRTREEARVRAEEAVRRLQDGEPWADVVRDLSDGETATRGGDLGWITPGDLLPEFEAVATSLEPGAVSGVVESAAGFHVIRRIE